MLENIIDSLREQTNHEIEVVEEKICNLNRFFGRGKFQNEQLHRIIWKLVAFNETLTDVLDKVGEKHLTLCR